MGSSPGDRRGRRRIVSRPDQICGAVISSPAHDVVRIRGPGRPERRRPREISAAGRTGNTTIADCRRGQDVADVLGRPALVPRPARRGRPRTERDHRQPGRMSTSDGGSRPILGSEIRPGEPGREQPVAKHAGSRCASSAVRRGARGFRPWIEIISGRIPLPADPTPASCGHAPPDPAHRPRRPPESGLSSPNAAWSCRRRPAGEGAVHAQRPRLSCPSSSPRTSTRGSPRDRRGRTPGLRWR